MSTSLQKMWIATLIIASYISPSWGESQNYSNKSWRGVVTRVADGDTLWVRPSGGGAVVHIRIDAIDAPEICQAWGREAKAALSVSVLNKTVIVTGKRRDGYGRLLARLHLPGAEPTDVGEALVGGGHAWAHQYKSFKSVYGAQQQQARVARRGLFGQAKPQHPREFRAQHGLCAQASRGVR